MKKFLLISLVALSASQAVAFVTPPQPTYSCPPGQSWTLSDYWVPNVDHQWFCQENGMTN